MCAKMYQYNDRSNTNPTGHSYSLNRIPPTVKLHTRYFVQSVWGIGNLPCCGHLSDGVVFNISSVENSTICSVVEIGNSVQISCEFSEQYVDSGHENSQPIK